MKKFILVFAAVAALLMSCQPEEEKAGSLSGEGYQFNFTIAPGGFDTATKGDATVGWTVGEKVYVFFKPEGGELLGDSYAEFTYTGSGWNPESYVAPGALGSSGKMAAVYVPYFDGKSPVYTDSKWTFDSGDVYYSCASGADYTVNGGTVRGTLSMKIPDGYVQFSIASAAEGDELACNMIDGYEKVTLASDLAFSTSPVTGKKMKGHADNGKIYFWGRVNGATATECEFTLTTSAGDVVLKVPAENVFKSNAFNIASSFEPAPLTGVPHGEFSVSAGKKVKFSKGNLWADGDKALHFEANQYSFASSWDASHVSHFTWSSTVASAVGDSYSGDNLFCDESHKVSVDGGEAIYYALSKDEWTYLFNNHSKKWAAVNGVNGYVIAPDGFSGTLADTYADDAALAANNLVFLPAAGYRFDAKVFLVGEYGDYWSSTAFGDNAYRVSFDSSSVKSALFAREYGYSVRLVTDVISVESVSLNKTATTIAAGATETLTATVLPETATDKSVTWSSSKESVATVDNTGKVTAVAAGEATITVTTTDGSKTATCTVTVTADNTTYTVTFDLNGITGTAPTAQTIASGSKVTKPTDPTEANHTFAGWYKTKDATTGALSDPWDFDNGTVTADMTLYAQWTKPMKDLLGSDFPASTGQTITAPENAWTKGNGYKAYIYSSGKFFKLDPGTGNGVALLTSNQFTRISDRKYVFNYVSGSTSYGVFTLNIEDSTLVSIEYDGTGTNFSAFSGTYDAAPTAD